MFPNIFFVASNFDEIRCMKLTSLKECFEGSLDSSGIISVEISNEEEFDVLKHESECEDEEFLAKWMKLDSWIPSLKDDPFEAQDAGSCFLKL